MIVSYAAGGDTDVSARIYAEKLSAALGQSVVVENKPGAGGMIGNSYVARAKASSEWNVKFDPDLADRLLKECGCAMTWTY